MTSKAGQLSALHLTSKEKQVQGGLERSQVASTYRANFHIDLFKLVELTNRAIKFFSFSLASGRAWCCYNQIEYGISDILSFPR